MHVEQDGAYPGYGICAASARAGMVGRCRDFSYPRGPLWSSRAPSVGSNCRSTCSFAANLLGLATNAPDAGYIGILGSLAL